MSMTILGIGLRALSGPALVNRIRSIANRPSREVGGPGKETE